MIKIFRSENQIRSSRVDLRCSTVFFVRHAKDDLWCPVIPSDDIWRHHEVGVCRSCQTKVQYFQRAITSDDDVRWLQILRSKATSKASNHNTLDYL